MLGQVRIFLIVVIVLACGIALLHRSGEYLIELVATAIMGEDSFYGVGKTTLVGDS